MKIQARLLLLLIGSSVLTISGCATFQKGIVFHPIDKHDIQRMKTAAPYAPEVDGWFVSDLYLKEVMEAKVEAIKNAH